MASSEGQGQTSQPSPEDYWLQCIKSWYPELHSRTYFLPPLHFNRVPYIVENVAGEQVLVPQTPTDAPSPASSTARPVRSKSREEKSQTEVASPLVDDSTTILRRNLGKLQLPPVRDNDVRDDRALQRVLYCLRELADNSQPKEVMMVISQLQFGRYLGEPSYAAAVAHLPRANTLHKTYRLQHYNEGNFDVLIIHKEHGLFTLEIKSVGANFSQLNMTEEREDDAVMKKVNDAVKQLDKAEAILKHLVSDVVDTNITKILVMPYISSGQLQRAMNRKPNNGKASNQGQGYLSQQSPEDYWLQCIRTWYPELHSRTYFLPPLHFNRVPYSVRNIADDQVLVAQIPRDVPSQALSHESMSHVHNNQTNSDSLQAHNSASMVRRNQDNIFLRPVYDSDVRDDRALHLVLHCLRELADNSQPKEVMMVISQLQFGKYLGEPSYAATAALLPRPSTLHQHFLEKHYDKGDFDVLIIHRQHGLFTLEIKSVGDNFSQLKMTEQQEDDVVMKKVKEAVQQLNKAEVVLKHLTSDLMASNITKILVMPNISSGQLLRAMNRNLSDGEVLCQCLGVHSVDDAVKLCLLSDQLSDKRTSLDVNHIVLNDLNVWWQQVVRASGNQPLITPTVYEHLVARFCGPATTVEVPCVTAPRLTIRTVGEAVSETGERTARLVLFPQQVELLNRSPPLVFLTGPPGTGKTILLILQGLIWLQGGREVHVVSTCNESRVATIIIENHLRETMRTTKDIPRVHRHQLNCRNDEEVETAVSRLESLNKGGQLCVIADEAVNYRESFKRFCHHLISRVPEAFLWSASTFREVRPLCLEEVKLTTSLRSPPVVVREVMKARAMKHNEVYGYTVSDVPVPTDGPQLLRIQHRDGHSGHQGLWPNMCLECGHQVARVLTELNVGGEGNNNGTPRLQYRDILILCSYYPNEDRVDGNGSVVRTASGLVRGLRACHVPVCVMEGDDEAAIRDTALGLRDVVTVTHFNLVHGLERKVVFVENAEAIMERFYARSRCTSQLVLIDSLRH